MYVCMCANVYRLVIGGIEEQKGKAITVARDKAERRGRPRVGFKSFAGDCTKTLIKDERSQVVNGTGRRI